MNSVMMMKISRWSRKRAHPSVALATAAEQTKLDGWLDKGNIIADICVDIAISGTPFAFFDKPEVRSLTNLAMKGAGIAKKKEMTADKIRTGAATKADKLRTLLKQKMKGKKLSLSADFGTRHGVDFLGMFHD